VDRYTCEDHRKKIRGNADATEPGMDSGGNG